MKLTKEEKANGDFYLHYLFFFEVKSVLELIEDY